MNKPAQKKSHALHLLLPILCLFFFCVFSSLGIWQLQRLQWKEALIERVESRLNLTPIPAPAKSEWKNITADTHEYKPVTAEGNFLPETQILVSSVTDYGSGYWLMQALQQDDSSLIFINRGFVPMDWQGKNEHSDKVEVTGLLRISEGAGFWPRRNDPERDRWYSRQLEAFATSRNLENVAPFFIDARASLNQADAPIGGLTIVTFRNTHLTYALTWFVMALGTLAAFIFLIIHNKRQGK